MKLHRSVLTRKCTRARLRYLLASIRINLFQSALTVFNLLPITFDPLQLALPTRVYYNLTKTNRVPFMQ